jgi:hypothetical protein
MMDISSAVDKMDFDDEFGGDTQKDSNGTTYGIEYRDNRL